MTGQGNLDIYGKVEPISMIDVTLPVNGLRFVIKADRTIEWTNDMIVDLNKQGIITLACCSGLQVEHPGTKFRPEAGYLALKYNQHLLEYLQKSLRCSIVEVKKSTCYFQPSISITIHSINDDILKEKWQLIWEKLQDWSAKKGNQDK